MSESEVAALLADHTPPMQAIAQELRIIVRSCVPEAEERVYKGWHAIGYTHPVAGYFGAIFPREAVVKLCFEWGANLPDPDHVLTGHQKRVRNLEITDEAEMPRSSIDVLLNEAIRYQLSER